MIAAEQLIGVWRLQSFDIESPDGTKRPWGKNSHGLLIYAAPGFMSVSINADREEAVRYRKENILKSVLFYSGRFEIMGDSVIHFVLNASDYRRVGQVMVREVSFNGDQLTLTGKGAYGKAFLVWRRDSPTSAKNTARGSI